MVIVDPSGGGNRLNATPNCAVFFVQASQNRQLHRDVPDVSGRAGRRIWIRATSNPIDEVLGAVSNINGICEGGDACLLPPGVHTQMFGLNIISLGPLLQGAQCP